MPVWEAIAMIATTVALFAAVISVVRTVSLGRRLKVAVEKKSEMQRKILDKFSSSEELNDFLNSEAGKDFVAAAELPESVDNPYSSILRSVRGGILAVALGVTLYLLDDQVGGEGLFVIGILLAVGGVAVLFAAAVSYFLSQKWGLLRSESSDGNMAS